MYVFAKCTTKVRWTDKGGNVSRVDLTKGDAWHRSDPFVHDRPDLFDDAPTFVHGTRGSEAVPASAKAAPPTPERAIETGRKAPGEKRAGSPRGKQQ